MAQANIKTNTKTNPEEHPSPPANLNQPPPSTIRKQLGENWSKLHPNIQERFARDPLPGEHIIYKGTMHKIRRSFMGALFAHLTRIIGNPLSPYAGNDVPMDVMLFIKQGKKGVYWQRTYYYKNKKPFVVTSVKRESAHGEMMECVGGGFGMLLDVYGEGTELHFKSYLYFCELLGVRIPLPDWLTPGQTHVIHRDLGEGDFVFQINMRHTLLGETFYQEGVFRRSNP